MASVKQILYDKHNPSSNIDECISDIIGYIYGFLVSIGLGFSNNINTTKVEHIILTFNNKCELLKDKILDKDFRTKYLSQISIGNGVKDNCPLFIFDIIPSLNNINREGLYLLGSKLTPAIENLLCNYEIYNNNSFILKYEEPAYKPFYKKMLEYFYKN
jgi:hypothetical protein